MHYSHRDSARCAAHGAWVSNAKGVNVIARAQPSLPWPLLETVSAKITGRSDRVLESVTFEAKGASVEQSEIENSI